MNAFKLGLMACVLVAGPALAGDANFTLINKTGYDIREVYLSPSAKEDWGKDRMGTIMLEKNAKRVFKFSNKAACEQDLKVVFDDDGSEVVWENFNLCELNTISLKYNRKTNEVSADSE